MKLKLTTGGEYEVKILGIELAKWGRKRKPVPTLRFDTVLTSGREAILAVPCSEIKSLTPTV
mgnify:CR=1 FL=1|jgi:hypothetical protein